jgi:hypothetical protein
VPLPNGGVPPGGGTPTNDNSRPALPVPNLRSIVVDPTDPNIVYIGGGNGFTDVHKLIRVDLTTVHDVYSFVNSDLSDSGTPVPQTLTSGPATGPLPLAVGGVFNDFDLTLPPTSNVLSLLRDPDNPFLAPSSLQFTGTTVFTNDGSDIKWQPIDFGNSNPAINTIVAMVDPVTGNTRLVDGNIGGVETAVFQGDSLLGPSTVQVDAGIGAAAAVSGGRDGNLQIGQITA